MKPSDNLENAIKNELNFTAGADLHGRILVDALVAAEKSRKESPALAGLSKSRRIMKSPITKLAAAAVIVGAVMLSITLFNKSVTPAYALEQTIEAMKNIGNFHFQHISPDGNMVKESWVEYDTDGHLKNIRVNYRYSTWSMVAVWKDGVLKQWHEDDNRLEIIKDELASQMYTNYTERYNPRGAIEYLNEQQGYVEVEIDESSGTSEPTIITATYEPNTFLTGGDSCPQVRQIYYVDNTSKFVSSIETYMLTKSGDYNFVETIIYCDYNQPVSYDFFTLENELSKDFEIIDRRKMSDFGLSQGNFTKEQIAEKLVKELLEALIEDDHEKAYMFFLGLPEKKDYIQKTLDLLDVVKVISIGPATTPDPYGNKIRRILIVPFAFENTKGEIINQEASVKRSFSGDNRWVISNISNQ